MVDMVIRKRVIFVTRTDRPLDVETETKSLSESHKLLESHKVYKLTFKQGCRKGEVPPSSSDQMS